MPMVYPRKFGAAPKKLHVLLTNKKKLEEIFNRIFDEEKELSMTKI